MGTEAPILIAGAGQAGATAAAALRAFGYSGPILVVGAEQPHPYERPPLSKAVLAGAGSVSEILVHAPAFYAEQNIDLALGVAVARLDTARHSAQLSNGTAVEYRSCLIATGGFARTLPGLDPGTPRVHYLRTVADALRLREALRQHRSILVVGGGFLGLEVASTARALGLQVVLLENAARLLPRALPAEFSDWLRERALAAGVDVRLGVRCDAMAVSGDAVTAQLSGGALVEAGAVVVAVGMAPSVSVAQASGITLHAANGGICVDASCRTSAPDVYAAGDCASQWHPHLGAELRIESWQNANEQARIAAAAMAGVGTGPLSAPWFWTDQFGCNLQMLGMPSAELVYYRRGAASPTQDNPRFMLLGADHAGVLKHAIAVNAGGDLRQLRNLIDMRQPCDPESLCDVSIPLRQLVRSAHPRPAPVPVPLS